MAASFKVVPKPQRKSSASSLLLLTNVVNDVKLEPPIEAKLNAVKGQKIV